MLNKVILIGRLTKDPDFRDGETPYARYTLAVDRFGKDKGADFISCVCFGKTAQFAGQYLKKGTKIAVTGHIQTGSYKNRDGNMVYTTDVVVDSHEFCEKASAQPETPEHAMVQPETPEGGFIHIPEGLDEELPFK